MKRARKSGEAARGVLCDSLHRVYLLLRGAGWLRHKLVAAYLRATVVVSEQHSRVDPSDQLSKIVILRLDDIGDFVLTTPFLRMVRSRFPAAHISLVINSDVVALARRCPYVNEVIPFKIVRARPPFDQLFALARARHFGLHTLAQREFQCAVIPRADVDNAGALAMAFYGRIPVRVGYSECVLPLKRVKNAGYDRFLTHPIREIVGAHEVEWSLNVASHLGIQGGDSRLELWPPARCSVSIEQAVSECRRQEGILVAIAPGANIGRRRWPISRFAALAEMLVRNQAARILLIGGRDDVPFGSALTSSIAAIGGTVLDLTGRLSLDEVAGVLHECSLFIGNDSGPMHIAAAAGVPCVEISCHPQDGDPLAANSPARFSPWGVPNVVLQPRHPISPCLRSCVKSQAHCITQITVDEAFAASCDLLGRNHKPVVGPGEGSIEVQATRT